MPVYQYRCEECSSEKEAFRRMADRKDGPQCCGKTMKQVILPAHIQPVLGGGSFQGYQCPVSDKYITSRKERREVMAKHDLIEKG